MTKAKRRMEEGLRALLLEVPPAVARDLTGRVRAREDELTTLLWVILTHVDYTSGACGPSETVAAALMPDIIQRIKATFAST